MVLVSVRPPSLPSMKVLKLGLTLVRHGETEYNKKGLLQGQIINSSLSETGLQQAEAAGRYLKDVFFTNVFVSDMLRAQQTADAIVRQNRSCCGLQMVCDPLLKERSFGTAEGFQVEDMRRMATAAGQTLPEFTPPEGETQDQVKQRVRSFFQKMLQQMWDQHWPDGGEDEASTSAPEEPPCSEGTAEDGLRGVPLHALVVSHGAYIRVALRYIVEELCCSLSPGCDKATMFSLSPNTGLSRFLLTVRKEEACVNVAKICCVFVHRNEHNRP